MSFFRYYFNGDFITILLIRVYNLNNRGLTLERRAEAMLLSMGLWAGIVSLIFGIIVMMFPKILNYLIGIYLIIIGILGIISAL